MPERAENPFALAERLLVDVRLTPGQLAQLRAINTKYYTMLAARDQSAGADDAAEELLPMIAVDVRDMLTEEQRVVFDRNLPRVIASRPESPA